MRSETRNGGGVEFEGSSASAGSGKPLASLSVWPVLVGLGLLALGILGALAPGAAVAAAIAALIIGLYVLYPIASLIPLFLWLLVQNSVVAILEARGLAEAGVWLRRSDEAIMLGLFSIAIITDVFGRGKAPLAGLAASICAVSVVARSEEHTSELQSPYDLVCRLLLEKKKCLQRTLEGRYLMLINQMST